MPPPAWRGHADIRRSPGSGGHTLLLARTGPLRVRAATWVGHEVASGSKVLVKGWLHDDGRPEEHWMLAASGDRAVRGALASGQLEFLDYPTVVERCSGTTEGLFAFQRDEVERAVASGWPSVALANETTFRPMTSDSEAADFGRQESIYDALAARWPLNTLCQLSLDQETERAVWESVSVHHGELVAERWSARADVHGWHLAGELDAHVAREFGAAVYGALRAARYHGDGPDLHVNLGQVEFMDVACAQIMLLAARSVSRYQHLILRQTSSLLRETIEMVGRPRTVVFADGLER